MNIDVHEEYPCINGESLHAGRTAYLVRCGGCNLRCPYCDTPGSRAPGSPRPVEEVAARAFGSGMAHLLLTGGEPMLQPAAAAALAALVLDRGMDVVVETNGTRPLDALPEAAVRVVDLKLQGPGPAELFLLSNLDVLRPDDQIKVVLADRRDYDAARSWLRDRPLPIPDHHVLLSPASPGLEPEVLAGWIRDDRLPYRLQLQIHKIIWGDRPGI